MSSNMFYVLATPFVLLFMIIVHEVGHALVLNKYTNKPIKIKFYYKSWKKFGFRAGSIRDYDKLTTKQYINVNLAGILAGYLPLLYFVEAYPLYLLLIIPYFFGCLGDHIEIIRGIREIQ